MDPSGVLAYAGAAVALLALPGPDWAFMVDVGARGRRTTPAVAGLALGYVLMALVVAAGIGPLIAASPVALVIVTVGGAIYLSYLGITILRGSGRRRTAEPSADAPAEQSESDNVAHARESDGAVITRTSSPSKPQRLLLKGAGVSTLNPKALVLFVAFLPQFVSSSAPWPLVVQLAVLGLLWAAMSAIFYAALGVTVSKTLAARPRLAQGISTISGAAMILLGLFLVGEQLVQLFQSTV